MSFFKTLKDAMLRSYIQAGRSNARRQLLIMSDRQLADFGFSRRLLEEGVKAWPWRESEQPEITAVHAVPVTKRVIKQAVNELSQYSDRELQELGVARHSIEDAVQFGRPAIEGVFENRNRAA